MRMTMDFTWETAMQARRQWSNIKGCLRKENFSENFLILANTVQKYIEKLIYHNQEIIQECKSGLVFQNQSV